MKSGAGSSEVRDGSSEVRGRVKWIPGPGHVKSGADQREVRGPGHVKSGDGSSDVRGRLTWRPRGRVKWSQRPGHVNSGADQRDVRGAGSSELRAGSTGQVKSGPGQSVHKFMENSNFWTPNEIILFSNKDVVIQLILMIFFPVYYKL